MIPLRQLTLDQYPSYMAGQADACQILLDNIREGIITPECVEAYLEGYLEGLPPYLDKAPPFVYNR